MGCLSSRDRIDDFDSDENTLLEDTDFKTKYDFVTEYNTKLNDNVEYRETISRRPSVSIFVADIAHLQLDLDPDCDEKQIESEEEENQNTVFIKKYFKSDDWNSLAFRREASILSQLSHENIISYIASYQDDIAYYLAIEYCNGGTLISLIYNKYTTNYNECIIYNIISTLISILSHCHSRNIVHRNICLENIHVLNGRYKLIGWDDAEIIDNKHDVYNDFVGSNVYYLSPETLAMRHGSQLKKIDLFAVGVIAFILSFGCVPFSGIHHMNICKKIMKNECNWPKSKNEYISDELLSLIKLLLSPHSFSRPTANEAKHSAFLKQEKKKTTANELIETVPFKLHCYQSSMKIRKLLMQNQCNQWTDFEQNELIHVFENIFNLHKEEICESDLENLLIKMGFNKAESAHKTRQFFDIIDVENNGIININSFNIKRRQYIQRIQSHSSKNFKYSPISKKQNNHYDLT